MDIEISIHTWFLIICDSWVTSRSQNLEVEVPEVPSKLFELMDFRVESGVSLYPKKKIRLSDWVVLDQKQGWRTWTGSLKIVRCPLHEVGMHKLNGCLVQPCTRIPAMFMGENSSRLEVCLRVDQGSRCLFSSQMCPKPFDPHAYFKIAYSNIFDVYINYICIYQHLQTLEITPELVLKRR